MSIKENFKRGFKDRVDLLMLLAKDKVDLLMLLVKDKVDLLMFLAKDRVDLLMFLAIVAIAVADLGFDYNVKGGYAFFAVYVSSLIYRIGFFKNALNKYVTNQVYRAILKLPKE